MSAAAITATVLLVAAGYAVILAAAWGVYRFRTRDERRRRRDLVRKLRDVFDGAYDRRELTPERRVEIENHLRGLHRG